jgi:hypothetical protein
MIGISMFKRFLALLIFTLSSAHAGVWIPIDVGGGVTTWVSQPQGDPATAAFWGTPPAPLTTRTELLEYMKTRACANGYPELCTSANAAAQRHAINGCSVLDSLGSLFVDSKGNHLGGSVDNLWFKRACNNHDECYQHGFDPAWPNQAWGNLPNGNFGSKTDCDQALRTDTHATCASGIGTDSVVLSNCHAMAEVFITLWKTLA